MKTIEVSNETYDKIKGELTENERTEISVIDDMIGKAFFFRPVTYHCIGRVVKKLGSLLELEKASWVASSGKFSDTIKSGSLNESEYVGTMWVNMDTVVDFFPWKHALPTTSK